MPHMQKIRTHLHICRIFPHMLSHFSAFLLVQRCFKTVRYFGRRRLPIFTIRWWINWSRKCQNCAEYVQNMPINDHNYDSLTLEIAFARNMRKNAAYMQHMQDNVPNISPNSAYFVSISSAYFKKILHNKPASLRSTGCCTSCSSNRAAAVASTECNCSSCCSRTKHNSTKSSL